jgi:hypothetical protein
MLALLEARMKKNHEILRKVASSRPLCGPQYVVQLIHDVDATTQSVNI